MSLVVLNLDQARFECTFGRGCDGICCRNGRPPIYPEESERIDGKLDRILPELRPEARAVVEVEGYVSRRRKVGLPTARIVGGWCVFFNKGCVLHRIGAAEGDAFLYKPFVCAVFPLAPVTNDHWYVRQKGYRGEIWDLFCLDPAKSGAPAAQQLAGELRLVQETVL